MNHTGDPKRGQDAREHITASTLYSTREGLGCERTSISYPTNAPFHRRRQRPAILRQD